MRSGPMVVDKFGGSVLTRPEDIAAAVEVVVAQRAMGLRPVVVVSAFEGVTDAILSSAAVLLPDGGASLRGDGAHAPMTSNDAWSLHIAQKLFDF